jgi:hypothetical protein
MDSSHARGLQINGVYGQWPKQLRLRFCGSAVVSASARSEYGRAGVRMR